MAAVRDIQPTHIQFYLHSLIFLNRWACARCVFAYADPVFSGFFYSKLTSTFKVLLFPSFDVLVCLCIYGRFASSVVMVVWHSTWSFNIVRVASICTAPKARGHSYCFLFAHAHEVHKDVARPVSYFGLKKFALHLLYTLLHPLVKPTSVQTQQQKWKERETERERK